MRNVARLLLLLAACLLAAPLALAGDYILSRSYFEDPTNALTVAQVEQEKFTPYEKLLTGGYKRGAYWLKLNVRASDQPLALKIAPAYIDEIALFDPVVPGEKPVVGANYPWNPTEINALSHHFRLSPYPRDRDVYLRVKSNSSYLVSVDVLSVAEYARIDHRDQLIYSGYVTITFILAVWLLLTWLTNRELVLGAFTLQQFLAFLHTFLKVGFAKAILDGWIEPRWVNHASYLIPFVYAFVAYLANKLLLQEYGLKDAYRKGFNAILLLSASITALFLLGVPFAIELNAALVLGATCFFWVSSVFGVSLQRSTAEAAALPIAALRLFYSFNVIVWMVAVLPLLGLVPAGEMALHSLFVYNMLSGLVFFFLLQYRARTLLRRESDRASFLKMEAEQERKQREEQGMLMAMLSHEIKTPLSVLKLVVDAKVAGSDLEGHANRAVGNIDFIVDRCLQLGKLDAKALQPARANVNCLDLLRGPVNDRNAESRVAIECPGDLILRTDPDLLRMVLSNLLENALKYAPAESRISVDAGAADQDGVPGAKIAITNAVGIMGAPDPDQIFKKYYRNPSATKLRGSGLGLYLAHEIIGVLGGRIECRARDQQVTFTLWMPT